MCSEVFDFLTSKIHALSVIQFFIENKLGLMFERERSERYKQHRHELVLSRNWYRTFRISKSISLENDTRSLFRSKQDHFILI